MDDEVRTNENKIDGENFVMRDAGGSITESQYVYHGKGKKGKGQLIAIILIVVLAFGSGFGGGIAAMYFGQNFIVSSQNGTSGSNITINPDSKLDTAEVIAKKVIPSVVGISTKTEVVYQGWFGRQSGISEGVGTGIIVDKNGYILTNSHVISDGKAQKITVQLSDGREEEGSVLWSDSILDLAIVKIEATDLQAASLGDSEEVNIGAYAVAIGNPLGMAFQRSVTQGIISGLDRSISVGEGQGAVTMDGLMQTDASINSGNSGGPLLNSKGEVIGINSAKVQSAEGLGFAIPINTAKPIVDEIKEKGEFTKAYIGISGVSLKTYRENYETVDKGVDEGVIVLDLTSGFGAEAAGVKVGDVIVALEGEKIDTMSRLNTKLIQHRPGDKVKLEIIRDKKKIELEVLLKAAE
ncbi:S1C family serine protease [Sinanaerobacter sp. ZZT-01]|uniref:S1C family serine protease n=1 Tax=Sinanaerobacter sp. ZZT-01 TaxID=3111540 RepID=UPI002D792671|nr:trypsin-like peptidase domain-containing protein [Sinanaerobacter sp. ZZT-01]WRR94745.1 trypsin-like peptidase domain-containing protein [Sinanaerobacter sp. ZZT-01]